MEKFFNNKSFTIQNVGKVQSREEISIRKKIKSKSQVIFKEKWDKN